MSSSLPTLLSPSTGPRLIVYHQTFHDADGTYHSLLPLLTSHTGITHVILAALHLNHGPGNLTLNDHLPDDERYAQLWGEVRWLQGSGVRVLAMLGGAAKGSFERLSGDDESFEAHYRPLHALITRRALCGLDLDIEEEVPLSTPTRLIARLRADFGPAFLITLAPVATALLPDPTLPPHLRPPRPLLASGPRPNPLHPTMPHLSGFSYPQLECSPAGREVAWYNVQFYCGWGDAASTDWYDAIIGAGWAPRKIVLGVVTNPANGAGHVGVATLAATCGVLRAKYEGVGGGFGGVMGWEYFNSGAGEVDAHAALVASLAVDTPTRAAAWVKALGRVLRVQTPPPVALPAARAPWPDDEVAKLVVLGFGRHEAIAALNATDGHVEMAAGLLFERDPS